MVCVAVAVAVATDVFDVLELWFFRWDKVRVVGREEATAANVDARATVARSTDCRCSPLQREFAQLPYAFRNVAGGVSCWGVDGGVVL